MASKITGAQVEYDPNAPLIDVDTAIEDLAEDLSRSGRRRQLIALQHLCSVARQSVLPWVVYDGLINKAAEREIDLRNVTTRVIVLKPKEEENGPSST